MEQALRYRVHRLGALASTLLLLALFVHADDKTPPKISGGQSYEQQRAAFYECVAHTDSFPRMKQVFDPQAVRVDWRGQVTINGNPVGGGEYHLWFSRGDVFVRTKRHDDLDSPAKNLVTIDGKLYLWCEGQKEGWILDRFEGDTLSFAHYWIDPSGITASIWSRY